MKPWHRDPEAASEIFLGMSHAGGAGEHRRGLSRGENKIEY